VRIGNTMDLSARLQAVARDLDASVGLDEVGRLKIRPKQVQRKPSMASFRCWASGCGE